MENKIEVYEKKLENIFKNLEDVSLFNQAKVLRAFQENRISATDFYGTTGYGYDD